jgi:hypothetical protein
MHRNQLEAGCRAGRLPAGSQTGISNVATDWLRWEPRRSLAGMEKPPTGALFRAVGAITFGGRRHAAPRSISLHCETVRRNVFPMTCHMQISIVKGRTLPPARPLLPALLPARSSNSSVETSPKRMIFYGRGTRISATNWVGAGPGVVLRDQFLHLALTIRLLHPQLVFLGFASSGSNAGGGNDSATGRT